MKQCNFYMKCRPSLCAFTAGLYLVGMMLGCNKKDPVEGLEVFAEYEHKRHHIYARIPKSDRWDAESGWVSPSADILCGTFEDIKNTLKTRGEKNAIYCQMGHTEVFEHGNVLVIATWSGDPSGNVYDIRLRAFDCNKIKGMSICRAGCNIEPSKSVGCSVHYVKVADRCFNFANSCTVYYDGYNIWADIVYIGSEPCRYRINEGIDEGSWRNKYLGGLSPLAIKTEYDKKRKGK